MPSFDIRSICSGVSKAIETPSGCLADEQDARDQLAKVWMQYDSTERSRCADLSSQDGIDSYVELLVCLQMSEDAKKMPND